MGGPGHFFIGGAQRCGTTLLYQLLDLHPQVQMARPLRPEPKFFLDPLAEDADLRAYERACFMPPRESRMRGEKSTSYLEQPDAARRIRALLPEARFIFVLRDPVERAISNYWFSVQRGVEQLPLAEALRSGVEDRRTYSSEQFSVSPFAYIRRGRYSEDLETYRRLFPRDRLKLVCFERFVADVEGQLASVLEFLGVDPIASEALSREFDLNSAPRDTQEVDPQLRAELAAAFVDSNQALTERFGFDVSGWHASGGHRS